MLNKDLILMILIKNYIILKIKKILKMNLILIKELNQDKVHLELLNNVKVKLIKRIMQLNKLNNKKNKLILQNYKLDNN